MIWSIPINDAIFVCLLIFAISDAVLFRISSSNEVVLSVRRFGCWRRIKTTSSSVPQSAAYVMESNKKKKSHYHLSQIKIKINFAYFIILFDWIKKEKLIFWKNIIEIWKVY
jgi:hypothetical protein